MYTDTLYWIDSERKTGTLILVLSGPESNFCIPFQMNRSGEGVCVCANMILRFP